MSNFAVECHQVSKLFDGILAVQDLSLRVPDGSLFALVGPSGCGKTTLLRLIAGFETPDNGTVQIQGELMSDASRIQPPEHRKVGMVFQDYALFPHLTVKQNIEFGLPKGLQKNKRSSELLELVRLTQISAKYPHEISGGEQQRVALARSIARRPAIVLLDEPFSNLDAALKTLVRSEIKQVLREENMSAIFVTHDQDEALSFADQVGVMSKGHILQTGIPDEIYTNPASLEVGTLVGESNILNGEAKGLKVTTELGVLQGNISAAGRVHALIRPESIKLNLVDESGSNNALSIIDLEYYGHAKVFRVQLGSGTIIRVRQTAGTTLRVGDAVTASVQEPIAIFPVDPTTFK
jgi:iron(III) transport system ATP-binding protein